MQRQDNGIGCTADGSRDRSGVLIVYRIIVAFVAPVYLLYATLRALLGKEDWHGVQNRRGKATAVKTGPVLWLHAASLGELKSVRVFLAYLNRNYPDHQLLVTVNNPLAMELARQWDDLSLVLQLAPLDTPMANRRFLDYWQPLAFFNVEAEIWPLRFLAVAIRAIPCVIVNARLSNKSAKSWQRFGLKPQVFSAVRAFYCQDQATAENFSALGIGTERIEVTENLKSLVVDERSESNASLEELAGIFDHNATILAASTHRGEDAILLDGFSTLLETHPEVKLILAPRHPKRGSEIAKLVAESGLKLSRRSLSEKPSATTQVYLADTLGEMPLFYALSGITLVAGSLVPLRGHTPYEPALYGSAIISGPHFENFEREYTALLAANGCRIVNDAAGLSVAFQELLKPVERLRQCEAARKTLTASLDVETIFTRMVQVAGLKVGAP